MADKRTFQIYRYDPDKDAKPYMQTIEVELDGNERMLLDAVASRLGEIIRRREAEETIEDLTCSFSSQIESTVVCVIVLYVHMCACVLAFCSAIVSS